MRPGRQRSSAHGAESGYALILVMFFLALVVLGLTTAAPTVLSNIQREKETEMIWRGKQYSRGIRLYYSKMKRYPTSLDDLTNPKTGIRFMRQAYKDPMNQVDGSWRLIYLGPNGQLIGSLNSSGIGLTVLGAPGVGGAQASGSSLFSAAGGKGPTNAGDSSLGSFGFGMSQAPGNSQFGGVGTTLANGKTPAPTYGSTDASSTDDPSQPQSLVGPMDASNTFGGNIVGVGSKVNQRSFMVYHTAKNYKLFEFIFDPSTIGRASAGLGTSIQNINGANPAGTPMTNSPSSSGVNAGDWINQMQPGAGNPSQSPNPGNTIGPNQMPLQAPPNP
jgi:hypothetical protein